MRWIATCAGESVPLPFITIRAFTGRDEVLDSARHRIEGTDGFLEVRLGDDDSASLFVTDT